MRTLYYHTGASAAARGLGVLDVRGDDRGRVFAAADAGGGDWRRAARLPRARQRSPISFFHASTLLQLYFQLYGKLPSRRFFSGLLSRPKVTLGARFRL